MSAMQYRQLQVGLVHHSRQLRTFLHTEVVLDQIHSQQAACD